MFDELDAERAAEEVFAQSLVCFMAKTIQAFETVANNELDLCLKITVVPDPSLPPSHPCMLVILYYPPVGVAVPRARMTTSIRIHPLAPDALVKFAIGHELGHLWEELYNFKQHVKNKQPLVEWVPQCGNPLNPEQEARCNLFATRLCFYHHSLNEDEGLRKAYKLHPPSIIGKGATASIDINVSAVPEFQLKSASSRHFNKAPSFQEIMSHRKNKNN